MGSGSRRSRRVRIKAEAIVEITDETAVIEAALADVAGVEFSRRGEREAEQAEIKSDAVAAVGWLVDAFALLADVPGAQVVSCTDQVAEVDEAGVELSADPDFVALFPVCRCGRDSCDACGGYQVTPRTAAVLWTVAQILADQGFDDIIQHGDEPAAHRCGPGPVPATADPFSAAQRVGRRAPEVPAAVTALGQPRTRPVQPPAGQRVVAPAPLEDTIRTRHRTPPDQEPWWRPGPAGEGIRRHRSNRSIM